MSSTTTQTWPPPAGLSTILVPHPSTTLTSSSHTLIAAPASLVLTILRNLPTYSTWNTWIPKATVSAQPSTAPKDESEKDKLHIGTTFKFYAIMDPAKPDKKTEVPLIVTDMSTPSSPSDYIPQETLSSDASYHSDLTKLYRICWATNAGWPGLHTERFHEIIDLGEGRCEVRTWENQGGLLARSVKWMYGKFLGKKFEGWVEDLKKYAEKVYAEGREG